MNHDITDCQEHGIFKYVPQGPFDGILRNLTKLSHSGKGKGFIAKKQLPTILLGNLNLKAKTK